MSGSTPFHRFARTFFELRFAFLPIIVYGIGLGYDTALVYSQTTRIAAFVLLGIASFFGFRFYFRHHEPNTYRESISPERSRKAKDWIIEEFQGR